MLRILNRPNFTCWNKYILVLASICLHSSCKNIKTSSASTFNEPSDLGGVSSADLLSELKNTQINLVDAPPIKPDNIIHDQNNDEAVQAGYFGKKMCRTLSEGKNPLYPDAPFRFTSECKDFCKTFAPADITNQLILNTRWLSWLSFLPENLAQYLGKQKLCLPIVAGILSAEYYDQLACERGSNCVDCGDSANLRTGCRVFDSIRLCAQTVGLKIDWSLYGIAARTCSVGANLQREIYRNSCRNSCTHSLSAALPIAREQPSIENPEKVSRKCCTCDRHHWVDYWVADENFKNDTFTSVTSDTNMDTPDCEGKEGTSFYPLATEENGYPVYYKYTNCRKFTSKHRDCRM